MGITSKQALDCFHSDDLIGIGMEADGVRRSVHPEGVVTYLIDRTLCVTSSDLDARIVEAVDAGVTGITLRGQLPTLAAWEILLSSLSSRFPSLWLHGLSASGIAALASQSGLSIADTLARLHAAGLQSLSGADADASESWLATHRAAHQAGLPSTAAMLFGNGETPEQRVAHLEAIHHLQQDTGGFVSFRPIAAPLPNFQEATAVEYLKTLAISRMLLDTVPHIEADWAAQGLKVLQMALRFGANDLGTVFPGESLIAPDGTTEEDLRRVIRGAGFRPVQRDTPHRTVFLS